MPKQLIYSGFNNTLNEKSTISNIIHSIYTNILHKKVPNICLKKMYEFKVNVSLETLMLLYHVLIS